MRVLENLKNMILETNEQTLPKCRDTMEGSLKEVLQRRKPWLVLHCSWLQVNAVPKGLFKSMMMGNVKREFLPSMYERKSQAQRNWLSHGHCVLLLVSEILISEAGCVHLQFTRQSLRMWENQNSFTCKKKLSENIWWPGSRGFMKGTFFFQIDYLEVFTLFKK